MQQLYKLIIKDKRFQQYKKLASFLFLINALIFIFLAFRSTSISEKIILFTASFILLAYAIYNWTYKKKKEISYILIYLLIAAIWMTETPFWYFSIIFLLLLVLQSRMETDFTISLSKANVIVNGFMKKEYNWADLNNVILKDDLLTLDFRDDKVLQVYPDWNTSTEINPEEIEKGFSETEKEFNEFCRQQLNK